MLHARVGAGLIVRASPVCAELAAGALGHGVAVALVRRDGVDDAAHGVRAVEQRCRAAHNLYPLQAVGIDRDTVVAGLAGKVARPDSVLHHQDAVAVEAADDWPARTWSEAPLRHTRLVLQRVAECVLRIRHELERIERRDRIERLERSDPAACGGRDRHFLVDRRQSKLERQFVRLSRFNRDGLPAGGEMLTLGQDLVGLGRHVLDLEPPLIVGECHKPGTDDQHDRAVHQVAVPDQRHGSSHDASFLPPSLRPQEAGNAERH